MRHFVHYNKRSVKDVDFNQAEDRWFAENQPLDQGFDRPFYHVTRAATGPAARVEKGDTIWLFSQLQSPWGNLPPALDAKIIVEHIVDLRPDRLLGKPAFRYEANDKSVWYPVFDCTRHLKQLKSIDSKGRVLRLVDIPSTHPGASMRRIRELVSAEPLFDLEKKILDSGTHFISYRLIDGTRPALELCQSLVSEHNAVWWDRWSLPRRLAERREFVDDDKLNEYILLQIRKCKTVWGIETDLYFEAGSYSQKEKKLASELGKYRAMPVNA